MIAFVFITFQTDVSALSYSGKYGDIFLTDPSYKEKTDTVTVYGSSDYLHFIIDSVGAEEASFVLKIYEDENLKNQLKQYLGRPFRFYYLAVDRYAEYPRYIFSSSATYPAILLKESGKAPILYNVDQIFEDDTFPMQFRKSFLKTWNTFAGKR